jgi:hypothetical protein
MNINQLSNEDLHKEYESTKEKIRVIQLSLNEMSPANTEEGHDLIQELKEKEEHLDLIIEEMAARYL